MDQHRRQNRPKIVPKSSQNQPQVDQDRPKIELGWGLGAIWAPRWLREPTWPRNPDSLDPLGPPSWEPKLTKNHWKINPEFNDFLITFLIDFGTLLGLIWSDFGPQNGAKIGPDSVPRAIMKQMQISSNSSAGAVFLRIGGAWNRSKIALNTMLS